ncbi:tetratricopeptide repeat protein [Roseomonas sp. 18066]|uniref:tetratricopeptide repeat protein n=1 Tax=Roseomonas sp. 18066 TaxID=2681412 RepID=UPI00135B2E55|nr:tetratricopeptide repeat protein [Roseomonas sp. 18066]
MPVESLVKAWSRPEARGGSRWRALGLTALLLGQTALVSPAFAQGSPPTNSPPASPRGDTLVPGQAMPATPLYGQNGGPAPPVIGAPGAPAGSRDNATSLLLDQASYWQAQNRPEAALQSLERLLRIQPNDTRALAMAVQVAASAGETDQAEAYLARLNAVAPNSPDVARAQSAMRVTGVDQSGIVEARRLVQAGRGAEALQAYRTAFGSNEVPDTFAVEYYQTQAGLSADDFREARRGLAAALARQPDNTRMKLALAQVLTFRETTRAQGIEELQALSRQPQTATAARAAWRQALLWLGPGGEATAAIEVYRAAYPGDAEIEARYNEVRTFGQDPTYEFRQGAFEALNAKRFAEAEAGFTAALEKNPEDVDSILGMSILRRLQKRDADWRALMARGVALAPDRESEFRRALGLDTVAGGPRGGGGGTGRIVMTPNMLARQAIQRGRYDEAEQQAQRSLQRGSEAERAEATIILAQVALQRGEWPAAEEGFREALRRRPTSREAQGGLYTTLERQGRSAEADAMAQATGFVPPRGFAQARSAGFRQAAEREGNPVRAIALLRQAVQVAPEDAWATHDLIRLLRLQGETAEADSLERDLAARSDRESLFAAALLAQSEERDRDVVDRVGRIPASQRNADLRKMLEGATIRVEVVQWEAQLPSPAATRSLLAIAARPDASGQTGAAVVRAFGRQKMGREAIAAARTAANSGRTLSLEARLALAGALLEAKQREDAATLMAGLENAQMTAEEREQYMGMRAALIAATADEYSEAGQYAQANTMLLQALQTDQDRPALLLALARLRLQSGYRQEGQQIAEGVLAREPNRLEAIMTAGEAALSLRQWQRADELISFGQRQAPSNVQLYMMEARSARAQSDTRRAQRALTVAQRLRIGQLQQQSSIAR